jgi:hypothetical protein
VTASVTPSSDFLQLHHGDCASPPSLITDSSSGSLSATVPAGSYYVLVGNPTDEAGRFSVHVTFALP